MSSLKMYGEDFDFGYEQPRMEYDKQTGDVKIIQKQEKSKRAILTSNNDL